MAPNLFARKYPALPGYEPLAQRLYGLAGSHFR